jgi:transcriptional regulator GlxA family with amidase domain
VPLDVLFVLTPGFLMLDFAGPAEAFAFAAREGASVRARFFGASPSVTSALGLDVGPLEPLPPTLPDGALVFLSGVIAPESSYRCAEARATVAWLRRAVTPGQRLACVCSAALLAARAGLLDGRRCTTHHTLIERLRALAPRAIVVDDRVFVDDGPVATSAGITAGIDLALHMIEGSAGPGIAQAVARELVVWLRRTGSDPQLSPWLAFRNHMHPAVHRAQDAISRAPGRAWSLPELAREARTSVRNLTRLFREHAGTTVLDYHRRIRVAHARQLLDSPAHSVERVAELVGLGSARSLRRAFAKVGGGTPSAHRRGSDQASRPGMR